MEKCKGFPDVRHVDCGGQISVGGEGYVQLPTGFGFSGGTFVVDANQYPSYSGFCLKCGKDGPFVRIDKKAKAVRKTPKLPKRKSNSRKA